MLTPPLSSVVCWKWAPSPGYRSSYPPSTVNTLFRMVRRHYPAPVRAICVTDDAAGIDQDIEIVPPWNDFAHLPSPFGPRNPSCYRRLRAFHPDIGQVFGPRFVSIDLDVVITGDLWPLWDRPEDLVFVGDTNPTTHYNGSMFLLTAGTRAHVWTRFDPHSSPARAKAAGQFGSDQGWASYCLGPGEAKWGKRDGVYSFRNDLRRHPSKPLPSDARLILFHGRQDPWTPATQSEFPWVAQNWR